jgi:hypothetical protein
MRKNQGMPGSKMLFAAILMSLVFVGTSQAQGDLTAYVGKFTLTDQVHWGNSVLQPGDYTITIGSTSIPIIALIRNREGRPIARFRSGVLSGNTSVVSALLMKEKDGQFWVHSLALADLRMVLIYDPALAREAVQEARVSKTVPVMLAKK